MCKEFARHCISLVILRSYVPCSRTTSAFAHQRFSCALFYPRGSTSKVQTPGFGSSQVLKSTFHFPQFALTH